MNKKSFTLVEIMVSIFIVVLILAISFTAYPPVFRGVSVAAARVLAWEEARRQIETLKQTDFATLLGQAPTDGAFGDPVVFNTPSLQEGYGRYYVTRMRDSSGTVLNPCDLLRVEVVVSFRAGGRLIGEETDLDGDNKLSSPITLVTLILK